MPFYAVAKGRVTGIYNSWVECAAQVKGFSGARYKKFDSASAANEYINANAFSGQAHANFSNGNHLSSRNNNLNKPSSSSSSYNSFYNKRSKRDDSESSGSDLEDIFNKKRTKRDDSESSGSDLEDIFNKKRTKRDDSESSGSDLKDIFNKKRMKRDDSESSGSDLEDIFFKKRPKRDDSKSSGSDYEHIFHKTISKRHVPVTFESDLEDIFNIKTLKRNYSKSTGTRGRGGGLEDTINKKLDDLERRVKELEKFTRSGPTVPISILMEPPHNYYKIDNAGYVQVYIHGAYSTNGKHGARAGLGVYWGNNHRFNMSEPVSGRATNNCGEIQAATMAIKIAYQNRLKKLAINTDSHLLFKSVTKWLPGWKRRGWKLSSGKNVQNESDFKELDSVLDKVDIKWNYVKAHKVAYANEMAEKFAKVGAALYRN